MIASRPARPAAPTNLASRSPRFIVPFKRLKGVPQNGWVIRKIPSRNG